MIDAAGDYTSASRRGQADIRVLANLTYPASADFALTTDITAWIPTQAAEGSLSDVRLVPSIQLSGTFGRPLWLRTRQAFVADTAGHTLSWSSAYGVDARLFSSLLALGAEVQLVAGQIDGEGAIAVGLAAEAVIRLGPVETLLGARLGLGPDAMQIFGAFSGLVALRFLLETP